MDAASDADPWPSRLSVPLRSVNPMFRNRLVSAGVVVGLALGRTSISNGQVTVGVAEPNNGNCIPIGCQFDLAEYQQVYNAAAFPAPMTIGALTFFHTQVVSAGQAYAPGTYN